MHADHLAGMPVLFSFATYNPWMDDYQQSFSRLLIDSGAYSELNSGKTIDGAEYRDWCPRWKEHADAIAGLDDIRGDWRKSLANYEAFGGFPTIHDSDPEALLADLIPIARDQGRNWLGIGLVPPRTGKERFVRWVCDNVPSDLHVHGWALREYTHVRRLDSVDSTNWFRDAWKYRNAMPFLTPAECVELVAKRYQRERRVIRDETNSACMFDAIQAEHNVG